MKILIFKIYKLFQWKFSGACLLAAILTVSAFAQTGAGDSVVIVNTAPAGGEAAEVAHWAETKIGAGLLNKFPCVDFASTGDLAAIMGLARMKELLGGGEPSAEQWQNLAGAVGARYIVVVSVTVLPNGQTIVSAKLLDGKTATVIANEQETAASAEAALQNAESVAQKLMQTFAKIFKNKCEAHWTGSITYTYLIQTSTTTEKSGAKSQTTETISKNLSATANIVLQPMTLGFSGKSATQARVAQNYSYLDLFSWIQTAEIPCREPGRNTYYKKATGDFKNTRTENGSGADVVSVFVQIFEDGRYSIYAGGFKPVKTTVRTEVNSNPPDCRPNPTSKASANEDSKNFVFIDLKGQVDPKNPNILTGTKVEGDLEAGQKTWTWNLRLVTPSPKKALK